VTDNVMIEAFRGDDAEVFYQALTLIRHSRNFLSGIYLICHAWNPLSGIHAFAFSFDFKDCGPRLEDCRGDEQGV